MINFRYLTAIGNNPSDIVLQDSTVLTILLGQDDLFALKEYPNFAVSSMSTYISFSENLVTDMNSNQVIPIPRNASPFAHEFYPDKIRPSILSYTINLTSERIVITFSDIMNTSSLNISGISLQSDVQKRVSTQFHVLSPSSSRGSLPFDDVIIIYLGLDDLNEVKKLRNLAADQPTTYLAAEAGTIEDMNRNLLNPIDPSQALPPSDFSADDIKPELIWFDLNMEQKYLKLYFSETVAVDTLQVSELTLQSGSSGGTSYSLTLNTITNDLDGPQITLILDQTTDVNSLKLLTTLAQNPNTTFISITEDFISDANANKIVPILASDAQQVRIYTPDTTGPYLLGFDLDLDTAVVTLSFDEPVSYSSLIFTKLKFHSDLAGVSSVINISNGTHIPPNDLDIRFTLTAFTLNQLKLDRSIATMLNNTYISIQLGAVYDLALIRNPAFQSTRNVTLLIPDTIQPELLNFHTDLNSGILTLNYDEVVDSDTLEPTAFTLTNSRSPTESYSLTGGNTPSPNGLQIILNLTVDDLNVLKQMEDLYTNISNTYLTFTDQAIMDMSGNLVTPVQIPSAIVASVFINDTTRPVLRTFDFDLNLGQLRLNFYETIDISTLRYDQISLQQSSNTSVYHTLTGGYLLTLDDDTSVAFNLTLPDLNRVKALQIGLTKATTWLTLTSSTINDMNGRMIIEIVNGFNARQVDIFTLDSTLPILQSFNLSVNDGYVMLHFSETVDATSLTISQFTLQPTHNTTDPLLIHTLSLPSHTPTIYSPDVLIYLSEPDLNEIKRLTNLAVSSTTTFLSITSLAISDMSSNGVVAISEFDALQVTLFTPDVSSGTLRGMDFDLNSGIITLNFSEPVSPPTMNISQFLILSQRNLTLGGERLVLNGTALTSDPTTSLRIQLTVPILNEIKRLQYLATNPDNTFISITATAIEDTNENFIFPVLPSNAIPVSAFYRDITSPQITHFDFDLSNNTLTLYFDETINASNLSITDLSFFGSNNLTLGPFYTLKGGSTTSPDGTVLLVDLITEDLNELKIDIQHYLSPATTFIYPFPNLIRDMSGNYLAQPQLPIPVSMFLADFVSPMIESASLDMDSGILVLSYNEVVDGSSLDTTEIYIQSRVAATISEQRFRLNRTLGSAEMTGTAELLDSAISIKLGANDLNELKRLVQIATSINNSYISFSQFSVLDLNSNNVSPRPFNSPIRVYFFQPDETRPTLLAFDIDMDNGLLNLTFDETVNTSSLRHTEITLQGNKQFVSSTHSVKLTGGVTETKYDYTVVQFTLTDMDFNQIKFLQSLATSVDDTFISLTNYTIRDMNWNYIQEVPASSAVVVSGYIPDTTPPYLVQFTLDMNLGRISLFFSETVNSSSLYVPAITLQDFSLASSNYTLTDSASSQTDSTIIYIYLSFTDLNAIKSNRLIATSVSDTYMSYSYLLVRDMNRNSIPSRPDGIAAIASNFTRDSIRPVLTNFSLNMDSGIIELTFSETIDTRNFYVTQITLQSHQTASNLSGQSYTLENSTILREDYYIIPIQLEYQDLNSIKQLSQLATSPSNTYIVFPWTAFRDMFNNSVQPISTMGAKRVLEFIPDTTRPRLLSGNLDLHDDLLTLTFSEMVNQTSLDLTQFTLLNSTSTPSQTYTLTTVYSYNSTYEGIITLTASISLEDMNQIKMLDNLATGTANTLISITDNLIRDMNGNLVYNVSQPNAIRITNFTEDRRSPIIQSFDLDLTTDILTLYFSETVNHTSFDITGLTLLNPWTNTSRELTIGSVLTQWYSPVLEIGLSNQDLDYIKVYTDLATNTDNTYLSALPSTVLDMNKNLLVEITKYDPLKISNFTQDLIRPNLTAFILDMNTGLINLTFSESVNASTLDVSQVSLQNGRSALPTDTFSLRIGSNSTDQGSFTLSPNWPFLTIWLGDEDLNQIKFLTQLATMLNDTYLRLTQYAIRDMNGNMVNSIPNGLALPASIYISDSTNASLTRFALDMNTGNLHLTFSETVNTSSLMIDSISLLDRANSLSPRLLSLSNGTILTLLDSTTIIVRISKVDLDTLKRVRGFADDLNDTYLAIQSVGVYDMGRNPLDAISLENAIRAYQFIPDVTRPILVSYNLDMNNGFFTLSFSETVESDSFFVEEITFQDSPSASRTVSLTNTSVHLRTDSIDIFVNISFEDLNNIKLERSIASVANGTNVFLTFRNRTIQDMNGNYVIERQDGSDLEVSLFTQDTTPPNLLYFSLDMNSGILNMTFDEVVDSLTYNVTSVYLQQHKSLSNSSEYYRLTTPFLQTGDGLVLSQLILREDLNRIKTLRNLAISGNSTYISINSYLVRDMNQNPIVPIVNSDALPSKLFIPDSTRPVLENFDLDMNIGLLTLYFDESMDAVATLDVSQIGFSSMHNGSILFSLSANNQSMTISPDVPVVEILIGDADLNELKRLQPLAYDGMYTYIYLSETTIKDTSDNFNIPVSSVQVANFTEDRTKPQLVNFTLDLSLELLTLFFSETVDSSTLDITKITFVSPLSLPSFTLTQGQVLSSDGTYLIVELRGQDLNPLKLRTDLTTMLNNTLISVTNTLVRDMNSNYNTPLNMTNHLVAGDFKQDLVAPQLLSYLLNMNDLFILLTFDEPVLASTINISQFTLLAYPSAPDSESHTLSSNFSYSTAFNGLIIDIQIGPHDANQIKYLYTLAQGTESTYLSFPETAIQDMNLNLVLPIRPANASNRVAYIRDISSPVLQSFTIDLTLEVMRLTFDETIFVSRTVFSGIALQPCQSCIGASQIKRLTSGFVLGDNSTVLMIMLSKEDLHAIKLDTNLVTNINNSYIQLLPIAVQDMALVFNQVTMVTRKAAGFTPDTVRPILPSFQVDLTREEITLVFDEPVNTQTLNTTAITFLNGSSLNAYSSYTPTGGGTNSSNGLSVIVSLSPFDVNQIKLLESLLISLETSHLSFSDALIWDMNNNPVVEITRPNPKGASFFLNDTTSPYLVRFDIDMDTGHMVLYFQVSYCLSYHMLLLLLF